MKLTVRQAQARIKSISFSLEDQVFVDRQHPSNIKNLKAEIENLSADIKVLNKEKEDGLYRWEYNNQMGSRGREAACIVVSPNGELYKFTGSDIPKVAKVISSSHERNGKWSNTTFVVLSRIGTANIKIWQSFKDAMWFPYSSWEELAAWIKSKSKSDLDMQCIKNFIEANWPTEAKRLDSAGDYSFFE